MLFQQFYLTQKKVSVIFVSELTNFTDFHGIFECLVLASNSELRTNR